MKYLSGLAIKGQAILRSQSVQNLALYGGTTSLGQFFTFIYTLLAARSLGPAQFGVYASCYSAAGVSAVLITWGMDVWLLRESASPGNLLSLAGGILRNKAFIGLAWAVVLVVGLPLIRPDVFSRILLAICAVDLWCDSCLNTQIACLNVNRKISSISRLVIVSRLGRLIGAIIILILGIESAVLFALARAIFSLIAFLVSWKYTRPHWFNLPSFTSIFRLSLPFAASEFLAQIYLQADVTILALLSTKSATGLYSTAEGVINALFLIPNTGYLLSIPSLSRLAREPELLRLALKRNILRSLALGAALMIAALLLGLFVLEIILGSQYKTSGILLAFMSPLPLLKSFEFGFAGIMVASGLQSRRLIPQAVSAAANVLLNILFIPIAGIYGVAVVYIISEIILTAGYGITVFNYSRKK